MAGRAAVGWAVAALLSVFRLWDGRELEATEWVRHGEEYVVTAPGGAVLILREAEIREVAPAGAAPAAPAPADRPGGRRAP